MNIDGIGDIWRAAVVVFFAVVAGGVGATSQPAPVLLPALPVLTAEQLQWVRELGSRPSDGALQVDLAQLEKQGVRGELIVEAMLAKAKRDRARRALDAELDRMISHRILGFSSITLHAHNQRVFDVYRQVMAQAGGDLKASPPFFQATGGSISYDADGRAYWDVVDDLVAETQLYPQRDGNRGIVLVRGELMKGKVDIVGPVRFVATGVSYEAVAPISSNDEPASRNFCLHIWTDYAPVLEVVKIAPVMKVYEAIDEHGHSLVPPGAAEGIPIWQNSMNPDLGPQVPLLMPKDNAGKRLVRFRAGQTMTVVSRHGEIRIADLQHATTQSAIAGQTKFTFVECRKDHESYSIKLQTVNTGSADPKVNPEVHTDCHVYDREGRELRTTCGWEYDNFNDMRSVTITVEAGPCVTTEGVPADPPAILVWEIPVEYRTIEVPIEFRDLDMNVFERR